MLHTCTNSGNTERGFSLSWSWKILSNQASFYMSPQVGYHGINTTDSMQLISFCVYGDPGQQSYIHTVDGPLPNTCRLVPWQQGYKMPNSFSVHLGSCLLSFNIYSLPITKWNCLVQMLNACVPHFFSWTMSSINAKIKYNDLRKQTKRSWQSC